MKKALNTLILFIAIASMTCFASCSKSKESMILGEWHYNGLTYNVTGTELDAQNQVFITAMEAYLETMIKDMVWDFKSDNTLVVSGINVENEMFENETTSYSIDGDNLILGNNGEDDQVEMPPLTIVMLTGKKLLLEREESQEMDGDMVTIVVDLEFKR